jgi:hypothetical protein
VYLPSNVLSNTDKHSLVTTDGAIYIQRPVVIFFMFDLDPGGMGQWVPIFEEFHLGVWQAVDATFQLPGCPDSKVEIFQRFQEHRRI